MGPDDPQMPSRMNLGRNRSCLLFGLSWSHDASFPFRLTHFYLGPWLLTVRSSSHTRQEQPR